MDSNPETVKAVEPPLPADPTLAREESKLIEILDSNVNVTKKAQFRKYLLMSGFKNAIIRAMVALYEDSQKPDDPLAWILGFLGSGNPPSAVLNSYQTELQVLRDKIDVLQQENLELQAQLAEKEGSIDSGLLKNEFDLQAFMDTLSDEEEFEE